MACLKTSIIETRRTHASFEVIIASLSCFQSDSKLIRMLMEAHGFSEVESSSCFFNLYWGNAHFNPNEIRQLQDWQKVNHFPR